MALHVLRQVVGPHEATLTNFAAELLLAGVRPLVARQLVRAAEPPPAAVPLALERLLTWRAENTTRVRSMATGAGGAAGVATEPAEKLTSVRPHVGLEVARLEVVLAAVLEVALVDAAPVAHRVLLDGLGRLGGRPAGDHHERHEALQAL